MTADSIQNKRLKMRAHIRPANAEDERGIELTRMQNFIEGRQDIFDLLEQHSANSGRPHNIIPRPPRSSSFETSRTGLLEQKYKKLMTLLNKYGLVTLH